MKIPQKIAFFISISLLLLAGCKKETLPPSSVKNQPVFSFNGNIGGNNLNLQAGVNNYYMYSSDTQKLGVYSFIGTLQSTVYKYNSIQIIINDDEVKSLNAASDIAQSVVANTAYQYTMPGSPKWDSIVFTPTVYHGTPTLFQYAFGDGSTASSASALPVSHTYKHIQNYPTSLVTNYSIGTPLSLKLANKIFLIKKDTSFLQVNSISSTVQSDTNNMHAISFTASIKGGVPPYSYAWTYNGSSSDTTYVAYATYTFFGHDGIDSLTLLVTDGAKDSASYDYVFSNTVTLQNNLMAYSVSAPITIVAPYSLSTVTVNYTDSKGNVYTSNNAAQSIASTFLVNSVEGYQNNTNNQFTKMLSINFSCKLYNTAAPHDSIIANNCTAIIAVAYN